MSPPLVAGRGSRRRPAPPARGPPRSRRSGRPSGRRAPGRRTGASRSRTIVPSRSRWSRAWYVSSARVEITTRSTRTPRFSRARREEVVGQRPVGGQALELHRDRARLPRPDPDREVAIVLGLLEDHDVAAREHVDADALDHHLDESVAVARLLAGHGRIIPRRPCRSSAAERGAAGDAAPPDEEPDDDPGDEPADMGEQGDAAVGARGRRATRRCRSPGSTNQKPEQDQGRHLDQLEEQPEVDERQDAGAREQDEVRAEDRGDRARTRR